MTLDSIETHVQFGCNDDDEEEEQVNMPRLSPLMVQLELTSYAGRKDWTVAPNRNRPDRMMLAICTNGSEPPDRLSHTLGFLSVCFLYLNEKWRGCYKTMFVLYATVTKMPILRHGVET